jgi:hypothetical protein
MITPTLPRFHILAISALFAVSILSGCKKSEDMTPIQPGETVTYKDDARKFSFKAPKTWVAESQPGVRTTYYSTSGSKNRFTTFSEGDLGARIEVGVDSGKTAQAEADQFRQSLEGVTFGNPETSTLGGQAALKISYSQGKEADAFTGYRIFAEHDSLVTYFDAATFGDGRMKKYAPIFDMAEKSVSLAHIIRISASGKMDSASEAALNEDIKPSETMSPYSGNGFTIDYPSNFNIRASAKGALIKGERNDATLQIDQLDNPSGDLTKFANENSQKVYRAAAVQSTKIGGQDAKYVNYSFSSAAGSRAYFIGNGKIVYRITINWPVAQEASYKPALEKSALSFKSK